MLLHLLHSYFVGEGGRLALLYYFCFFGFGAYRLLRRR